MTLAHAAVAKNSKIAMEKIYRIENESMKDAGWPCFFVQPLSLNFLERRKNYGNRRNTQSAFRNERKNQQL